jgi:hypothetical protein
MPNLATLLPDHNWYTLRAIAYAHNQSFDSQSTKKQAIDYIISLLTDPPTVRRALSRLTDEDHEALLTLLTCEGQMLAHRFLEHFGPIRPYRPWRDDASRAPWRRPASPAERLWFLGLIFVRSTERGKMIVIPEEIRSLLPKPPPLPAEPIGPLLDSPDPILDLGQRIYISWTGLTGFTG